MCRCANVAAMQRLLRTLCPGTQRGGVRGLPPPPSFLHALILPTHAPRLVQPVLYAAHTAPTLNQQCRRGERGGMPAGAPCSCPRPPPPPPHTHTTKPPPHHPTTTPPHTHLSSAQPLARRAHLDFAHARHRLVQPVLNFVERLQVGARDAPADARQHCRTGAQRQPVFQAPPRLGRNCLRVLLAFRGALGLVC